MQVEDTCLLALTTAYNAREEEGGSTKRELLQFVEEVSYVSKECSSNTSSKHACVGPMVACHFHGDGIHLTCSKQPYRVSAAISIRRDVSKQRCIVFETSFLVFTLTSLLSLSFNFSIPQCFNVPPDRLQLLKQKARTIDVRSLLW